MSSSQKQGREGEITFRPFQMTDAGVLISWAPAGPKRPKKTASHRRGRAKEARAKARREAKVAKAVAEGLNERIAARLNRMLDASTEPAVSAFREAAERREIEPLLATLAPDVVIRSPVSERLSFTGIEQARELFGVVFEELGEFAYTDEFEAAGARVLVYRGRFAGEWIEEVQLLRLDAAGRIREVTFFIRPLPGLAGVAAGLAPRFARRRRKGPLIAALMRVGGATLKLLASIGDRLGARLFG